MYKWLLPTISEVLAFAGAAEPEYQTEATSGAAIAAQRQKAEREWCGAIAALSCLLEKEIARPPLVKNSTQEFARSGERRIFATQENAPQPSTPPVFPIKGVVLSGSVPVLSDPVLMTNLSVWTFTSVPVKPAAWLPSVPFTPSQFPPANTSFSMDQMLPLLAGDPLTDEQFCVVLTGSFSLVVVRGEDATGTLRFQFSFEPEVVRLVWQALRSRLVLTGMVEQPTTEADLCRIDAEFEQFPPVAPDYKTVCTFAQLLLQYMPEPIEMNGEGERGDRFPLRKPSLYGSRRRESKHKSQYALPAAAGMVGSEGTPVGASGSEGGVGSWGEARSVKSQNSFKLDPSHLILQMTAANTKGVRNQTPALDVELLQAIAHEVRTPLATIRTLTRLLMKRPNLEPDILKRLECIDRECTEQIDRFGLIFRAVELETSPTARSPVQLTSTSLTQVFQSCIPRWQKQASRRNLTLDVVVPQKMPPVVSDPTMLDQVLTGVIENFTSSLAPGGHVQVQVVLAGHQLKVQLHSQNTPSSTDKWPSPLPKKPTLKSIGQMLMFQPETGNLSLNMSVTKNLFQALGGKLIVRQRPQQGEVLTIFLPLELGARS